MRKIIALTAALLLLAGLCACTQVHTAAPLNPEQTPESTPPPEGMAKFFGKEIVIACDAPEDGLFAEGVRAQAEKAGIPLRFVGKAEQAQDCDALIHYGTADAELPDIPYVTLQWDGKTDDHAAGCIVYEKDMQVKAALETMFTYPSHEAPVRILGLFSGGESEAAREYARMEAEGKLQSKGTTGSDGAIAVEWLERTLSGIGVGVLDTVFAETPRLAMDGFEALKRAQRNDAVEICAAGLTRSQIEAMLEDHFLMGAAVGLDEFNAGMLSLRMCAGILAGEDTDEVIRLEPFALCSDAVYALKKQGVTEPSEILEQLNGQTRELCDYAFLRELSERQ